MAGKLDRIVPWQGSERLVAEAAGPARLLLIEDGHHVANSRAWRYRAESADWLADTLGVNGQRRGRKRRRNLSRAGALIILRRARDDVLLPGFPMTGQPGICGAGNSVRR